MLGLSKAQPNNASQMLGCVPQANLRILSYIIQCKYIKTIGYGAVTEKIDVLN